LCDKTNAAKGKKKKRKIKLYAICSERQSEANKAMSAWNIPNFSSVVGDNGNVIARAVKETYMPKLHITVCSEAAKTSMNRKAFPNGCVQPAVLIFVKENPVLAWAVQPSRANLQGSLGRPEPKAVWKLVEDRLKDDEEGIVKACSNGEDLKQAGMYKNLCQHYLCGCSIS